MRAGGHGGGRICRSAAVRGVVHPIVRWAGTGNIDISSRWMGGGDGCRSVCPPADDRRTEKTNCIHNSNRCSRRRHRRLTESGLCARRGCRRRRRIVMPRLRSRLRQQRSGQRTSDGSDRGRNPVITRFRTGFRITARIVTLDVLFFLIVVWLK